MENKKIGLILVILSLVVGSIFIYYTIKLAEQSREFGCFDKPNCFAIERGLSVSHIAMLSISITLFTKNLDSCRLKLVST